MADCGIYPFTVIKPQCGPGVGMHGVEMHGCKHFPVCFIVLQIMDCPSGGDFGFNHNRFDLAHQCDGFSSYGDIDTDENLTPLADRECDFSATCVTTGDCLPEVRCGICGVHVPIMP
ncbi:hypothetical protein SDC9_197373 [bioreactor metagenome]|uniref:Uncharacterized protein n=1 Tax=bioreactor metagenome TaxID=1076179 RepID=A0A645IEJ8_9ZZZZ